MDKMNVLKAIICGYEKSGTTLLNEILRRHPDLDSGFECGFLLGDSPADFSNIKPYHAYFKSEWELTRKDMKYIFDTENWLECYHRARERSPIITNKKTQLFDKTPIYMKYLAEVLAKVPETPCIVNVRDPRALMLSWANWSGHSEDAETWILDNIELNTERYNSYGNGYRNALKKYKDRILLVQFEKTCQNPELEFKAIFEFIGLEFKKEYLSFSSKHFVYGNSLSQDYINPYKNKLSNSTCDLIVEKTERYACWHYN
jgi:hypothetical protein